jgi:hypothetical protein
MKPKNNLRNEDHRGRVKSDFPKHSLDEALRVAKALADKNGGQPLPPTETAIAIGISPGSSEFRTLLSSSIKYGLTSGSFNSEKVSLEDAGRNIAEPRSPEDERKALVEAALTPPTFKAVYGFFRGKKLPDEVFFQNTVVREFSVPREHAAKCVALFNENMERVGLVRVANTGRWLSTTTDDSRSGPASIAATTQEPSMEHSDGDELSSSEPDASPTRGSGRPDQLPGVSEARLKRVFITHGKNKAFITPLRDLLTFGQLEAVVAVERESVARPVPEKVMNDMRTCGAAIIHIEDELRLVDVDEAKPHVLLNQNVLIEIGAAMALYGKRFILLVKEGVELPSNLSGLYEVRYGGDKLDGDVTIRLLKAINELKKEPLPSSIDR